ncbi:MAG TPA: TRAP transporter large permease [Candidatus Acidoferrum sp.]|nr:TRAP transporter large permease [Candidatus Acidoferrum sp.]
MTLLFLFGSFFLLLVMGMPIVFAMGLSSVAFLALFGQGIPLTVIPHQMVAGVDNFPLLAIPFFFLAGELMNAVGITQRLVDFAAAIVGHIRGGLAYVVIVTNVIMAGFSGSALADASATGAVLIPAMKRQGYHADFAAAITSAAATIGPIIPPSIPMIIYAVIAEVSVGSLFLSGVIPGLLMGLYLFVVVYFISRRRGYPVSIRSTVREFFAATRRAIWALMAPIIILGGIVTGVVTATEAGVLAVVYSLIVGFFIHRELHIRDLPGIFCRTAVGTSVIMIIVGASGIMGWLVANMKIGDAVLAGVSSLTQNPQMVLLLMNLFFLVVGCLMDPLAGMLVFVPVFMPLIKHVQIDPVHFGLVVVLNLMIGLLTPPVGYLLYMSSEMAGVTIDAVVREVIPLLIALLMVLAISTYWPGMVMFIPNLFQGVR